MLLCSDCRVGRATAGSLEVTTLPEPGSILLEQWTVSILAATQAAGGMDSLSLLQEHIYLSLAGFVPKSDFNSILSEIKFSFSHTHTRKHTFSISIYFCLYLPLALLSFLHLNTTHTRTHKHTHTQTNKQPHTQTHNNTHNQTNNHTSKHTSTNKQPNK